MGIKRLLSTLSLIMATVSLTSGCWDARDIDDKNIVTAVVVDRTDYGYAYYVEIPKIAGGGQKQESSEGNKIAKANSEGRDSIEARDELDKMMDQPLFLGAIQTVIFTDRMASYGIDEYLMRLRQIPDYRKTAHVVVTTDDPEKLLSDIPENDISIGFAINDTLQNLVDTGRLHHVTLIDILEALSSPYKHYIIPTITLVNEEATFTGFTVFSGGMKTGFIPAAETKSICFMVAKNPKVSYTVPYKDTFAAVEVSLAKKKIKPHYSEGKPSFDISLKLKAVLRYPEQNKPITDMDLELIRNTLQAMLEQEFSFMLIKSREVYKYDCYNLHTPFRIAFPEEYKAMDWAGEYQKASMYLSISVDLAPNDLIDYSPKQD